MLPIKQNNRRMLNSLYSDPFDHFFGNFRPLPLSELIPTQNTPQFDPDIYEQENEIIIAGPLAGVNVEDVKITLDDDCITIQGEIKSVVEQDPSTIVKREGFYKGEFFNTYSLSSKVDSNNVKATYKDGVLKIKLTKLLEDKNKSIKIEIE